MLSDCNTQGMMGTTWLSPKQLIDLDVESLTLIETFDWCWRDLMIWRCILLSDHMLCAWWWQIINCIDYIAVSSTEPCGKWDVRNFRVQMWSPDSVNIWQIDNESCFSSTINVFSLCRDRQVCSADLHENSWSNRMSVSVNMRRKQQFEFFKWTD